MYSDLLYPSVCLSDANRLGKKRDSYSCYDTSVSQIVHQMLGFS